MKTVLATAVLVMSSGAAAAGSWVDKTVRDEMTGEVERWAFAIESSNEATFDAPYGGPHRATLLVFAANPALAAKRGSLWTANVSAMITIEAQILHNVPGRISLDGDVSHISFSEASDNDPNVAFISFMGDGGVESIIGARQIKIELTFYQNGSRIFTFDTTTPLEAEEEFAPVLAARLEAEGVVQKRADAELDQLKKEIEADARTRSNKEKATVVKYNLPTLRSRLTSACKPDAEYAMDNLTEAVEAATIVAANGGDPTAPIAEHKDCLQRLQDTPALESRVVELLGYLASGS